MIRAGADTAIIPHSKQALDVVSHSSTLNYGQYSNINQRTANFYVNLLADPVTKRHGKNDPTNRYFFWPRW